MTIGRIDAVEPIQNKNLGKINTTAKNVREDSVHISAEAKEKADLLNATEIVASAPELQNDRVAELKAKINDPAYLTEAIIAGTTEKILDVLFPSQAKV